VTPGHASARHHRRRAGALGLALLALLAGCNRSSAPQLEQAATVDGAVISTQAMAAAAGKQAASGAQAAVLDRLISEQLFANAATAQGLEQQPQVAAALESARRQVLARAYVDQQSAKEKPINQADVTAFYQAHPELFAQRKVFRVQELAILLDGAQKARVSQTLQPMKTFGERAKWLKQNGIVHESRVVVRPAEDWPADLLQQLQRMKDGGAFEVVNERGLSVLQLTGIEDQPLTLDQAKGRIAQYLSNERGAELIKRERAALAAKARIEYRQVASAPAR